jgi:hypothetical protein
VTANAFLSRCRSEFACGRWIESAAAVDAALDEHRRQRVESRAAAAAHVVVVGRFQSRFVSLVACVFLMIDIETVCAGNSIDGRLPPPLKRSGSVNVGDTSKRCVCVFWLSLMNDVFVCVATGVVWRHYQRDARWRRHWRRWQLQRNLAYIVFSTQIANDCVGLSFLCLDCSRTLAAIAAAAGAAALAETIVLANNIDR